MGPGEGLTRRGSESDLVDVAREPESDLYPTDRKTLEREVEIETFRYGGPGGQHADKTESAVRITHLPSGVVVTASDTRSQRRNRELAFERLIEALERLNRRKKPRIPTGAPRSAEERRLHRKKRRAEKKRRRIRVDPEEGGHL